jgi:hypothetical protein
MERLVKINIRHYLPDETENENDIMQQITLKVTLKNTKNPTGSTMHLKFSDNQAKAVSGNGTKIELGGTFGGGYEVCVGNERFYVSAKDIWNAISDQFNLEKVD